MDLNNSHESNHENEDVLPGELLEESWFFGNLLHTKSKSRMLRSFSDPCSSSNFPGNSYEDTYESIKKLTPTTTTKESRSNRKTSSKKNSLVRAPSLPISLESEDVQDEEIEFSMGKLIRQASLNYSDNRPPRKNVSKSLTASSSSGLTQQKTRRKSETAASEQRPNQLKTQKSMKKDIEIEELQGNFLNLGLDLEGKDLSPNNVASMEKKRAEAYEYARPYLSAWAARSSAPPVPRWGGKRSTDDMKAQIKFWARAVASNVRQEC